MARMNLSWIGGLVVLAGVGYGIYAYLTKSWPFDGSIMLPGQMMPPDMMMCPMGQSLDPDTMMCVDDMGMMMQPPMMMPPQMMPPMMMPPKMMPPPMMMPPKMMPPPMMMCPKGTRYSPCFKKCRPAGLLEPSPSSPLCKPMMMKPPPVHVCTGGRMYNTMTKTCVCPAPKKWNAIMRKCV